MPETRTLDRVASSTRPVPLVTLTRGEHVESTHYGHIAVVDAKGSVLAWAGDAQAFVFPRSAFKPFQAVPLVESGAFARSGLHRDALALIAGSHGGSDAQVKTVLKILEAAGADPSMLLCGAHEPYDRATAKELRVRGEQATPVRHNCSGKHAGMLLLARAMGAPLENYIDPSHPVQRGIFERFEALTGQPFEDAPAIDGCSAPTPRMKLSLLAQSFAMLARGVDHTGMPVPALAEIRDAMMEFPENVAGEGRLDTELMRTLRGGVVSKAGAEGMHATGFLSPGTGIALKIADGDAGRRALKHAVVAVLDQLSFLSPGEHAALLPESERIIHSYAGLVAGEIRPTVTLTRTGP